jgi:phospholipid transport system substrate-binding protein
LELSEQFGVLLASEGEEIMKSENVSIHGGAVVVPLKGSGRNFPLWRKAGHGVLVCLAVGAGVLMSTLETRAANSAESFVEASIGKGNAILNAPLLDPAQRQSQFRDFLLSITDTRRVALFTLGSYARAASEPVIATFVAAFIDFDTAIYRRSLDSYSGQTIRVTGSTQRSEDDAIVNADVLDPNGKSGPLKIAFRVRKNDSGKDVLTDLQIEGAWLALSQQSDFTSYLQQHDGDIAQLSRELELRIGQMRSSLSAKKAQPPISASSVGQKSPKPGIS